MANLADVTYKVVGPEESIDKLFNLIEGANTQVDAVVALGLDPADYYPLRGEIVGMDQPYSDIISIWQSCAWNEQAGFRRAIETAFPDVKVFFQTEEPGCEVYETNDEAGSCFPELYKFTACLDGDYYDEYFETLEDALFYIEKTFGLAPAEQTFESLAAAVPKLTSDYDKGDYAALNQFLVVED